MTGQQLRWSAEQVLTLAPDAASRKAGSKLAAAGPWSDAGTGEDAVWGLCRGSGSKPYRTAVDLTGPASTCSCPSRKFPCKHALGLLLRWAEGAQAVPAGEAPEWAASWLEKRRERRAAGSGAGARRGEPADPEAARRRAERRAHRVAAGAAELEQRLADLLHGGIAGADQAGYARWDEMAARMVDAQAPGLASRIRELAGIAASGPGWPARLLAECALLHLLCRGVLALEGPEGLPEPLAATVRAHLGLTTEAAALFARPDAVTADRWLVLGRSDGEDGRLTVRRFWLRGERHGRSALLLSFGAAGRAPELTLPVGRVVEAELAFHPGEAPLRAALGERRGESSPGGVPPGVGVARALAAYGERVSGDPWLESWPVVLADVVPSPGADDERWQLADEDGGAALPLAPASRSALWKLAAISGGGPVTVFGACGHRGFTPHTVWSEGEAVSL
ncbi:SWIM zinc finger family protein [Streptomyces sp. WMMC1477]|uniref:SWIM zinc finger family protein n=1 Tax=Streptomyces sp. WMMC1477 TaxID=3015155 RepID=UPI0022B732E9|nr:SWIM zinc finger family protein [Streptomyces sp. WMMC1477]MCZ7433080.1 SWIM zinc finger domain-containing protein [Streptomyces sp. WMMC1477]